MEAEAVLKVAGFVRVLGGRRVDGKAATIALGLREEVIQSAR